MRRTLVLMAVLGLLAAMAAPAVGAPPVYREVSTCETYNEVASQQWVTGGRVLHRRDVILKGSISGDYLFDSTAVLEANVNANMVNWKGNLWGSLVYDSKTYPNSGWEGTWHGQWTGEMTWEGSGVARGYGDFSGMQWRFDVTNVTPPDSGCQYVTTGYVFTPGG